MAFRLGVNNKKLAIGRSIESRLALDKLHESFLAWTVSVELSME